MKLSAVVITGNEEANIERCLASLKFCDEIIVVDSESSDSTVGIARKYTEKVFSKTWSGYVEQKNFANSQAEHDWILSVDADEEVSSELQTEILQILFHPRNEVAFSIPRKTIHSGRWIKHGGWYPNRLVRLFKKTHGKWEGAEVHEFWKSAGPVGQIKGDLIHYSFDGISDQVDRNNHYSTLGAMSLLANSCRFSFYKLVSKTISKFAETYFVKLGFLDGFPGFIIAVSAAYSVFLKWAKLWELERHGQKT